MGFCPDGKISHDASLLKMNEVLAERVKVSSGDVVIDLGCGVGGSAIWLAENIGCRVVGVDINEEFLRLARQQVRQRGLDGQVSFHRMDFRHLSFPDAAFDVAWALESSCYVQDKRAFLAGVRRVLGPRGRLVVADGFVVRHHEEVRKWAEGWAVTVLVTVSGFERALRALDFTSITYEDITRNILPSSARLYRYARALYPLGRLLEWLGLRTRIQTDNIVSAIYQHRTLVEGLWQYGVFTAEKAE
jgi:ubiquinone/menaquinone biosynthesis C-methylase UbiE